MILTVTFNPTIDRVLFVRDFQMQELVRAEREVVSPSGKGIDVSIIAHAFGEATLALGLSAGHSGGVMAALLDAQGVPHHFVQAMGETRMGLLIMDEVHKRQSTLLAPTLCGDESHLAWLLAQIERRAAQSWGLVSAGSLPPGLPADSHARVLQSARRAGLTTLFDSSGESLRQGVAGRPDILKVNSRELGDLAPELVDSLNALADIERNEGIPKPVHDLAETLRPRLGEWANDAIVITLGKVGALAITADGGHFAPALEVPLVSPAGAGDGVSAGLMMARRHGRSWVEALALGTAVAAAIVQNEGTAVCTRAEVEALLPAVAVHSIDL